MNYASQRNRNQNDQGGSMNRYGNNMNAMGGGGPPGGGMNPGGHLGGNMPGMPHLQSQHSGGQYGGGMGHGGYGLNQFGGPPQGQHGMPPGGGLGGPMGHQPYGLSSQMPPHNPYGQGIGGYGGGNMFGQSGGQPNPQAMMRDMNPQMQNGAIPSQISPYGGSHQNHSLPGSNIGQQNIPNHQSNQYHPGQQHGAPPQSHNVASNSNQIGGQIDQYGHIQNANRAYGQQPQNPDTQSVPKNIQSPSYQHPGPEQFQNGSNPSNVAPASNSPLKSGDLGSVANQTQQLDKGFLENPNEINMHQVNQSANTVTYDPLDVNQVSPLDPAATSPPNQSLNPSANGQDFMYAGFQQQPQPIKSKLPIAPLSQEDIDSMNKEYLEPLVNSEDALFII